MDRKELIEKYPESKSIVNYIQSRYKKGLLNVVKFIGLSGTGKSWASLRLAELISLRIHGENNITVANTVDNLLDLIKFIRAVKKEGEVVVIEEAEVLFPSRRAMSGDNVDAIKIFDTIRKKKIIVILNYPLNKSIDGHLEALCNLQIETIQLNKTLGVCILKPIILQVNVASGKTYFHRVHDGDKEVHRCFLMKPSEKLCWDYENKKDKFMDDLHQDLQDKQEKKRNKVMDRTLTDFQHEVLILTQSGLKGNEIAKKLNKPEGTISVAKKILVRKRYLPELMHSKPMPATS